MDILKFYLLMLNLQFFVRSREESQTRAGGGHSGGGGGGGGSGGSLVRISFGLC